MRMTPPGYGVLAMLLGVLYHQASAEILELCRGVNPNNYPKLNEFCQELADEGEYILLSSHFNKVFNHLYSFETPYCSKMNFRKPLYM